MDTSSQTTRPIGILDSGVGGLSILCELQRTLPQEDFIYFGDTLHAPYGSRDEGDIRDLIDQAASILLRHSPKALVLGSSTITTVALDHLRAIHSLPIVGTDPAISLAVEATRSPVIGVLSTRATAHGELLDALISQFARPAGVRVMKAWHNDLVPLIERGQVDTPAIRALLHELLDPLAQQGVDQLVLASTHFTFLKPIITAEFGSAFSFVDSAGTVATDVACLLDQRGLRNSGAGSGSTLYLFTGDTEHARTTVAALLNLAMPDNRIQKAALDVRSALAA
jgi:glutamate racemase